MKGKEPEPDKDSEKRTATHKARDRAVRAAHGERDDKLQMQITTTTAEVRSHLRSG